MHSEMLCRASVSGRHAALVCPVGLFMGLAFAYSLVTPVSPSDQHNPDENAHVVYFQAQGRLLFAALVPVALFLVLRWRGLVPSPRHFSLLLILFGAGLLALSFYTLFGLLPRLHAA